MIVVADTSPINYLIQIKQPHLLKRLFGTVIIPPAVQRELLSPSAPDLVRAWTEQLPRWITSGTLTRRLIGLQSLDEGEMEAISLAVEQRADLLLIDEYKGRKIAADWV